MVSEVALSLDLAIILLAAAFAGYLAKQTGQPTIIAYLLAGVIIGPVSLGIVEVTDLTETLSELGLAFLLFLLGIKMRIDEIRDILYPIVKISLPQMAAVGTLGAGVALALGFDAIQAAIIGLAVMYSSTAVVIKMLNDRGETTTLHGKIDVGVLLAQDIVVVILLAVLAAGRPESAAEVGTTLAIVLVLVAAITIASLAASRLLLPRIFRWVAEDRQIFFLIAISWAFLFVFVSDEINVFLAPLGVQAYLSIEMGAFLAGLAIAQLPYSKELQDRVNPLTDLFVMIFFVSVAFRFDAADLLLYWEEAVIAAIALMIGKFVIFFALLTWQRFDAETTFLGSLYMVQVSEFGIVVGVAAVAGDFIGVEILGFLALTAMITMGLSVYFFQFAHPLYDRLEGRLSRLEAADPFEQKANDYRDHAVVIGYDDVTRNLLNLLDEHFDDLVVVDRRVDHIHELEAAGYDAVFGDIGSAAVRKSVGPSRAALIVSSSDDPDIGRTVLRSAGEETIVIVEAQNPKDAEALYDAGADYVIRSVSLSSDRLADYLVAHLNAEDSFDRAIDRDIRLLRHPMPFRDLHRQIEEVDLDD